MGLDWTFTAESYLDQLPREERAKVLRATDALPKEWDRLLGNRLNRLTGDPSGLFAFQVGADLRVIVRPHEDRLTVVDVVRRSQVEGLRQRAGPRAAAG